MISINAESTEGDNVMNVKLTAGFLLGDSTAAACIVIAVPGVSSLLPPIGTIVRYRSAFPVIAILASYGLIPLTIARKVAKLLLLALSMPAWAHKLLTALRACDRLPALARWMRCAVGTMLGAKEFLGANNLIIRARKRFTASWTDERLQGMPGAFALKAAKAILVFQLIRPLLHRFATVIACNGYHHREIIP
jgi:hypothetical protein